MATLESILRVFSNCSNRDNKLRARKKWLVDTMGFEEMQERIFKERKMLVASSSWPGGIPEAVRKSGDAPAGLGQGAVPTPIGPGTPVTLQIGSASWRENVCPHV